MADERLEAQVSSVMTQYFYVTQALTFLLEDSVTGEKGTHKKGV